MLVRPIPSCGRRRPVPDMPLADVEPVPRCSRRGLCRQTVDSGNGGHCPKLDQQITVAHAVLAHSSGARYVPAKVGSLTSSGGISCCRVRRFLPSSLCLSLAATGHVSLSTSFRGGVSISMQHVMGSQYLIMDVQI